jgi:hypothetical protein
MFLLLATAVCGCGGQIQEVPFQVSDIKPGFCKAIDARPGYFWQSPQRVMPCRINRDEQLVFVDPESRSTLGRKDVATVPNLIVEPAESMSERRGHVSHVHSRKSGKPSHRRNRNHQTLSQAAGS